jgi:hypothetical protein
MSNPQRWAVLSGLQTNLVLLLVGCGLLGLSYHLPSEFTHFSIGFSLTAGWSAALYLLAVVIVLTQRVDKYTLPLILLIAVACRLVVLFPFPYLSSDIYRYVWDGVVQHARISPYRYVPDDDALATVRAAHHGLFDHMNRRDYAPTIYPPAAQFIFYLVTSISPTVVCMKIAMMLFEALTVYALIEVLREIGVARERCLIYAWCPLLIWEIGSSGHVDAIVIAFMCLALLARLRHQPVLTGVFLGLAIATKLYPLVLFPALYRRNENKMPVAMCAVIAFGYACYASVGLRVFGFLGGYVQEEGMDSGARYFLLELVERIPGLHTVPAAAFMLFAGTVFALLCVWCWKSCDTEGDDAITNTLQVTFGLPAKARFLFPAFALAVALMILFSPHYPWYIAWLVPFLTVVPDLSIFIYVCVFFYMCTTSFATGAGPKQFLLNEIVYGICAVALVADLLLHRRSFGLSRGETSPKR